MGRIDNLVGGIEDIPWYKRCPSCKSPRVAKLTVNEQIFKADSWMICYACEEYFLMPEEYKLELYYENRKA